MQHGRWRLAASLACVAAFAAPAAAEAKTTLVEVHSTSHAVLNQLESLGLDVTYEGDKRTELMLHGPEDVQILKDTGLAYDVLMEDMDGANDARLKSEEDHQTRVDKGIAPLSTLPTGRVAYRDLATINAELQQLATTYPDKVKLFTLNKTSLLGKTIYGVEVSTNVAQNVGKPTFLLTGAHHAREWPTAEFTMEFIWDLLLNYGNDVDAKTLLDTGKLIAVPVVNVDGYDLSRSLQNEQKRKNCRITSGVIPTLADCTASANVNRGIDLNRNYLPFWGGPGSSTSATASNTRGEAPASEPEIQGMIDLLNRNPATVAINNHTPDQRLLRAPSSSNEPDVLADQTAYQGLLDRLSKNLPGWPAGPWTDVYYEASSTAEQQAYYAYGAFGFTPEATPGFSGNQTFHPPYQNVIDNYLGTGTRYAGQTMRGLYYDAFKAATEPNLHSVIAGTAPAGAKLTLTKTYSLDSSLTVFTTGQPAEVRAFPNGINASIIVPATGKFEWHVNPSLRPSQYTDQFVDESYTLTCTAPDGTVLETTTVKIARGQLVNRSLCTQGGVGGSVPSTLALTLGAPASFGAFTPGIAKEYDAGATATTTSTAGNALLTVADPDGTNTGKLVNGAFALATTLRAAATSPAGTGAPLAPVGGSASPTSLLTYTGPVSNDPVAVAFKQAIGANDALRTGTYSKTLTFTLSTTNP
ncbi:M14 family zinc carboxypeptidase [Solirubrobacter soli]|uniref:M14 family zinc carboxypeptidase n=1 Tax=Solirubrobacter soli TaxID=363832 RepID=UPI00042485EA|nr:M14 family zinc carboxypeptidase [Solirubrobacter soli]